MKDREFMQLNAEQMWLLKQLLDIKKRSCHYCKARIKKGDKFGIFNKPTRLICNSVVCMATAIEEDTDLQNNKEKLQ